MLNLISFLGGALIIWAYFFLSSGRFTKDSKFYHALNLVGAVLIGISLWFGAFNVGSFMLQIMFGLIALVALVKN